MPQALSAVYLHVVFSTEERLPLLAEANLRARLHGFIGAVSREMDCPPLQVGGVADHVHLLARYGRQIAQSDWVKELKRVSSRWVKTQGPALRFAVLRWTCSKRSVGIPDPDYRFAFL